MALAKERPPTGSAITSLPEPGRTSSFAPSAEDTPKGEEADQTTWTKKRSEQQMIGYPTERQPRTKEVVKYPDLRENGDPPRRSCPAIAKTGYQPVTPDDSRPAAANRRKHSITSTAEPISGHERLPTPQVPANCDEGNRTCTGQSTVWPAPVETERSIETASHGALHPIIAALTAKRSTPTERNANPTWSSAGKERKLNQIGSTPAPQRQQKTCRGDAQSAPTTPRQANKETPPRKVSRRREPTRKRSGRYKNTLSTQLLAPSEMRPESSATESIGTSMSQIKIP